MFGSMNRDGVAMAAVDELCRKLDQLLMDGDVVLVKGSRIWGMERVIATLRDCG